MENFIVTLSFIQDLPELVKFILAIIAILASLFVALLIHAFFEGFFESRRRRRGDSSSGSKSLGAVVSGNIGESSSNGSTSSRSSKNDRAGKVLGSGALPETAAKNGGSSTVTTKKNTRNNDALMNKKSSQSTDSNSDREGGNFHSDSASASSNKNNKSVHTKDSSKKSSKSKKQKQQTSQSSSNPTLEKLQDEINEMKRFITSLPVRCNEDMMSKAHHQEKLSQMETKYVLIMEKERVASVVQVQEELYPPNMEECPICLEVANTRSMQPFLCCGGGICEECVLKVMINSPSCPLCRASLDPENLAAQTKENAKRGQPWALYEMGAMYMNGKHGFPVDRKDGMRWWQIAADQNDPESLYRIAGIHLHHRGLEGLVEKNETKGWNIMKQAADGGESRAQAHLASWYLKGRGGPKDSKDASLGVHYATLACVDNKKGVEKGLAAYTLGVSFSRGWGGLKKSIYLAKHYFEMAAQNEYVLAYHHLANLLFEVCKYEYGSNSIPGHSPIPKVFFWYRKAARMGVTGAKEYVQRLEETLSKTCDKCSASAGYLPEKKLKQCAKCKSVWYCGRQCQLDHWKNGHKRDCVKQEKTERMVLATVVGSDKPNEWC